MKIRTFIETVEGMYFAVVSYVHPKDRIIAFLRYVPYEYVDIPVDKSNIREINGKKYVKMADSDLAYKFLREKFSEYLFYDEVNDILIHAVPNDRIKNILKPEDRLKEILENSRNALEEKCRKLAIILEDYGVNLNKAGVTGSLLLKLNNPNSDIDFVVYGEEFNKARMALKEAIEDGKIEALTLEFWKKAYEKRIKDNSLTFEEFIFHEKRKYNRGVIDGTMFDLLFVRDRVDEKYGEKRYKGLGYISIEGKVLDDKLIFDSPAVYKIECYNDKEIKELCSFTHTYAGQCFKGEEFIARGKLEEVITKKGNYKRVVVGTKREAYNEYIKVKRCLQ